LNFYEKITVCRENPGKRFSGAGQSVKKALTNNDAAFIIILLSIPAFHRICSHFEKRLPENGAEGVFYV
jgi:hypothetical protein